MTAEGGKQRVVISIGRLKECVVAPIVWVGFFVMFGETARDIGMKLTFKLN